MLEIHQPSGWISKTSMDALDAETGNLCNHTEMASLGTGKKKQAVSSECSAGVVI